jgi:hypothetical protein
LELENALLVNVAMNDVCLREHVKAIVRQGVIPEPYPRACNEATY